ncbi:Na+/H+ antiporter NhaC [Paraglaciecola arctica]|uniref:Na+:H+ antiporter, NhaC family n=1 Tax=Paraglaciecola arctica BSs20135 TaxID=493475 RepID=K6ZCT1_9ALTE|nr:Na+/H+ antiporter NhaC [Paraglaciecola arctica]GAC21230.1 Na+:H+ antiporter, NhaC family [Paraglaciecola arctica BSs20135]
MTVAKQQSEHQLPLYLAMLPFAIMLIFFICGSIFIQTGNNVVVVSLLAAAVVATLLALKQGQSWDQVQSSAAHKLASLFPALLILLAIGALIGSWVLSGTIPYFVAIGLRLIDPETFVLTAFLSTAIMSLMTGTSWGSIGTLGVAMMGMAPGLEASPAMVAGAVVSGAYFGDKMSPLSDTTNVAALAAGVNLYTHIRHMLYTAVPAFLLAAIVFFIAGSSGVSSSSSELPLGAVRMLRDIDMAYVLNWWTLIPPFIVLASIAAKLPPVLGIAASSLSALVIGVSVQDFSISSAIDAAMNGFNSSMFNPSGVEISSFSEPFLTLINRGGVYVMVDTLVVIVAAILLTGAMEVSGALNVIITRLLRFATSVFGLIAATMSSGLLMISLSSHGSVTALIVGNLFQGAYKDRKLAPENLSRSLEDSVTLMDPILPWTVSGVFIATTLGVATLDYAPWAIFCLGGPLFSLFYAFSYPYLHFGIKPLLNKDNTIN